MELTRQWLLGVACAAMAAALCQSLLPEGGGKRICRLAGGLALLLAAVHPLLGLDADDLNRLAGTLPAAAQGYSQALEEENDLIYQSIIERKSAAYILDKAETLGISCQVEVKCRDDQAEIPSPYSVLVWGRWTQEQRSRLEEILQEDLGIPPQRQRFEERVP